MLSLISQQSVLDESTRVAPAYLIVPGNKIPVNRGVYFKLVLALGSSLFDAVDLSEFAEQAVISPNGIKMAEKRMPLSTVLFQAVKVLPEKKNSKPKQSQPNRHAFSPKKEFIKRCYLEAHAILVFATELKEMKTCFSRILPVVENLPYLQILELKYTREGVNFESINQGDIFSKLVTSPLVPANSFQLFMTLLYNQAFDFIKATQAQQQLEEKSFDNRIAIADRASGTTNVVIGSLVAASQTVQLQAAPTMARLVPTSTDVTKRMSVRLVQPIAAAPAQARPVAASVIGLASSLPQALGTAPPSTANNSSTEFDSVFGAAREASSADNDQAGKDQGKSKKCVLQ